MKNGTTKADVIKFYNDRCPKELRLKTNGRLAEITKALRKIVTPGMMVLDVGCGIGETSKCMAELGATVMAIDIAGELIVQAQNLSNHENITYFHGDVTDAVWNWLDNVKFDLIVFADSFEHIDPKMTEWLINKLAHSNSHEKTLFYVNIPDCNFMNFMQKHYPEKLQIIDVGYPIGKITGMFLNNGYALIQMRVYGVDCGIQYNEYLFLNGKRMDNYYFESLALIYKEKNEHIGSRGN